MRGYVWVIILAVVLIASVSIWSIGSNDSKDVSAGSMDESATTSGQETSQTETSSSAAVEIIDYTFSPKILTINVGTTVTWTNQDTATHTASANDNSFDSGLLNKGQSYSFTFTQPGEYTYYCKLHQGMKATIIVK